MDKSIVTSLAFSGFVLIREVIVFNTLNKKCGFIWDCKAFNSEYLSKDIKFSTLLISIWVDIRCDKPIIKYLFLSVIFSAVSKKIFKVPLISFFSFKGKIIQDFICGEISKKSSIISSSSFITNIASPVFKTFLVLLLFISAFFISSLSKEKPAIISVAFAPKSSAIILHTSLRFSVSLKWGKVLFAISKASLACLPAISSLFWIISSTSKISTLEPIEFIKTIGT